VLVLFCAGNGLVTIFDWIAGRLWARLVSMQNSIDAAGLTGKNDWKTWFSKVVSIAYEMSLLWLL